MLRLAGILGVVDAAQKLLLLAIVFLAGFGMHRLVAMQLPGGGLSGRLFAGFVYAVNPFVYERLIAGQWFLLLGYALPWGFAVFLSVGRNGPWAAWRFALVAAIAGYADPHMAVLLSVLCVATLVARGRRQPAHELKLALLALTLALCTSLLWLLPTPGLQELWSHVGRAQLELYGTFADPRWGPVLTVLGLGGFWDDHTPAATALPSGR